MSIPDLRRQPGPHVFVDDLAAPVLADEDHRHLAKSLRLRGGDPLTMSDGDGRWCSASFGDHVAPTSEIYEPEPPPWPVTVAFALTKAGKPELVIQKATELGVDSLVLFHGEHSVPRWDAAKRAKAVVRLERVAREAAMQSRQLRIPQVIIVDDLAAVMAIEPTVKRADFTEPREPGDEQATVRALAIGPEGGWSDSERELVPSTFDLGPSVLRAETAALIAGSHMTSMRQMGQRGYP